MPREYSKTTYYQRLCDERAVSPADLYAGPDVPVNTVGRVLKAEFGRKMVKLALDGGFTCPNRDGTKGTGGCAFCSAAGSGDNAGTIDEEIALLSRKWPDAGYIAYFQGFTSTYADADTLRRIYGGALSDPRIEGIAVATRPDCLPEDILDLLSEINGKRYLWVELGLQTSNAATAEKMGLCYSPDDFVRSAGELGRRGIRTAAHLIFGLPGETMDDMLASVRFAAASGVWGVKYHMLNVVKGSRLASEMPDYMPFSSPEEYISLVCDALEMTPPETMIHRMSADSPAGMLIAPKWAYRKRRIIDGIYAELKRRGTWQGSGAEEADKADEAYDAAGK